MKVRDKNTLQENAHRIDGGCVKKRGCLVAMTSGGTILFGSQVMGQYVHHPTRLLAIEDESWFLHVCMI